MTIPEIMAMTAGGALDLLVHQAVNAPGRVAKYSEADAMALKLITHLPLFVARAPVDDPSYNPLKPFIAGTLITHPQLKTLNSTLIVKAETLPLALCKAALIFSVSPKERPKQPSVFEPKPAPRPVQEPMPIRSNTARLPEPVAAQPDLKNEA